MNKVPMKQFPPTPEVVAFVNDLKAAIGRHQHLKPEQMLAGASQLVGNLIALQNRNTMTVEMAMEIVDANIETGNRAVIEGLFAPGGKA